jgi:photosystem II stability/assembly factor-like uncharacterized protein
MKKSILAIMVLILLNSSLNAQWEILSEGFKGSLNTIDFVDENIGWIAGTNGTLLKTTDGGESWFAIAIDENWDINQIDFINDSVGWAVGSMCEPCYGIIIETVNGGSVWSIQKQVSDIDLNSICIIDENNIYAIGGNKVYKTSNGGLDWNDVSPNSVDRYYYSMWFPNPDTGVVIGAYKYHNPDYSVAYKGVIMRTTEGGTSWDDKVTDEFETIRDLQFLDDTTGYFIAHGFLCKTEDLLRTWEIKTQSTSGIRSYQFLDSNTVYAIITDSLCNIAKSTDGGMSWVNMRFYQLEPMGFNKIYFYNSNNGFLTNGWSLYKSTDAGFSWGYNKFSFPFSDLFFIDENEGFAGGTTCCGRSHAPLYSLFSTTNSGESWSNEINLLMGEFHSITFLNDSIGFYLKKGLGFGEIIYKSSNAGKDWHSVYDSYDFEGYDISFLNDDVGWAVGMMNSNISEDPAILITTDGGSSWDLEWQRSVATQGNWGPLYSVCSSGSTAWAVGEKGMTVKYTPQTGWMKQTSVTDLPLKKVLFFDDNYGWISGGYQNEDESHPVLLRTTNGGDTWEADYSKKYLLNDLWFINCRHGWAVGSDAFLKGVILETEDGGDNWIVVVDSLIGPLNSIFVKDNYAWAVGNYGLVLRTTNLGITWIDDESNITSPTEFKLGQNYPNPFNPSTKIQYALPITSKVELKVYDVLGREVATLVNEEKTSGNYEINFNGSNLPSGIYFHRLQAGSFVETKKMILLK